MNTSTTSKMRTSSKDFFRESVNNRFARHTPAVNIQETDQEYLLKLAAPGFQREEIAIEIKNNIISIGSLRKSFRPEHEVYRNSRYEYDFSVWERKFALPPDADAIMANAFYINGELLVHIPKDSRPQSVDFTRVMVY
ncbi:MAG: Hsp20/alpha crystallin family protein [Panacibacter sp.]